VLVEQVVRVAAAQQAITQRKVLALYLILSLLLVVVLVLAITQLQQ
jgi:hypothetical protein